MKAIKITSALGSLGALAALVGCSGDNGKNTALAAADANNPVGGSSWTRLEEVLDCQALNLPGSIPTSIVDELRGKFAPQNQTSPVPTGNGANQPGAQPMNPTIPEPNGNSGSNLGNAGSLTAACPGGSMLFELNNNGAYRISDGSTGNLSAQELQQVNQLLGSLSANALAQPLECQQNNAINASGANSVFAILGNGTIVTLSSRSMGKLCTFKTGSSPADANAVLQPILQSHLAGNSSNPNSDTGNNNGGNNGGNLSNGNNPNNGNGSNTGSGTNSGNSASGGSGSNTTNGPNSGSGANPGSNASNGSGGAAPSGSNGR